MKKYYGMLEFSFSYELTAILLKYGISGWFPLVTFNFKGFSGMGYVLSIGSYDRTTPDPVTLDPTTPDHTYDHTTIRPYDPGPKFDIYSLQNFSTTDGLVNTQDIGTCQSFLGHVEFRVFILS